VPGVKPVAHSGVFFADPVFWPFSSFLQDFDLLGGKVDRPAASVLISDNFVHFLDLVAFGTIPSGVCIIAPFTTSTSTISHFLRFLFRSMIQHPLHHLHHLPPITRRPPLQPDNNLGNQPEQARVSHPGGVRGPDRFVGVGLDGGHPAI
jgi:hypothetical protein